MKNIAVLITDRVHEALRISVGLTLMDDKVSVFVMDAILKADGQITQYIDALAAMGAKVFTNNPSNPFEYMSTETVAAALVGFDVVIPY